MPLETRYAPHPEDARNYDTEALRRHFLIDQLFQPDGANLTYSHIDRIIIAGIMPVDGALTLPVGKEMGVDSFFMRREAGIINIGGAGIVTIDDQEFELNHKDGLYIGKGPHHVTFSSLSTEAPAKFYLNSAPAHHAYPHVKINIQQANPVRLGDDLSSNKRTIYQYVHPDVCDSCQLVMGLTMLEPGSVWNTMPCHTHERRMEVYFYFDIDSEGMVAHFMGQPEETRHIMVANEQAVISPSWSIHSGVGTSNYTFVWGMCGENQTFDDMDHVVPSQLK